MTCPQCPADHDEVMHYKIAWQVERDLNHALADRLEAAQTQTLLRDAEDVKRGGFRSHVAASFEHHAKTALALTKADR